MRLKIVRPDYKYCDYLRSFDYRVAYNKDKKELRPFIGILFTVEGRQYFAPLSSPKPKHLKMKDNIDFFKVKEGQLGAVNFNNMIPITEENYEIINVNDAKLKKENPFYQNLLKDQLEWLEKNGPKISKRAFRLYKMYKNDKLDASTRKRCCNFPLLEEKCEEYANQKVSV